MNNIDNIEQVREMSKDDLSLIEMSSFHMFNKMDKVREHLIEIQLNDSVHNLIKIIDQSIIMVKPFIN